MVFAKSEEQKTTAEEDVEDKGRVKLLNHLDVISIFRKSKLNLQSISCTITSTQLFTSGKLPWFHNLIQIGLSTFLFCTFLRIKLIIQEILFNRVHYSLMMGLQADFIFLWWTRWFMDLLLHWTNSF